MTFPQPRPEIAALPPYVPGARGDASVVPVKLSSNERPHPPAPGVADAIAFAGESVNRYPDMAVSRLYEALAAKHGVDQAQLAITGGSVAAIGHALQAYAAPGSEVVFAWRSFEAYPILTMQAGATPVRVPLLLDARHDLDAMAAAITDRTSVLMVCSPNNPTGPAATAEEFEAFMAKVPDSVLVLLDEAYLEYVADPAAVKGAEVLASGDHPNVVVLRTFSKAYGLAGLRVGYAIGPAEVIAPIRACVTPFSVSSVAESAALAALADEQSTADAVADTVAERTRVMAGLRAAGWDVPDSQGNFVWLGLGDRTAALVERLGTLDPPVLIRPFTGEGARISIGARDENDAVLAALADGPRALGDDA